MGISLNQSDKDELFRTMIYRDLDRQFKRLDELNREEKEINNLNQNSGDVN